MPRPAVSLLAIKLLHTIAWAFFAGCILAIPVAAWMGRFRHVVVLVGIVLIEVGVVIANGMRCPLTGVAARYTDDRRDNFDIFLPLWLARYNKTIFGSLFVAGSLYALARWQRWIG